MKTFFDDEIELHKPRFDWFWDGLEIFLYATIVALAIAIIVRNVVFVN